MKNEEYLEEERKKLWGELESLKKEFSSFKDEISKRTPEYEAEAKQSSKKAAEYKNRALRSQQAADESLSSVKSVQETVNSLHKELNSRKEEAQAISEVCTDTKEKIEGFNAEITELNTLIEAYDESVKKVDDIDSFHERGEETTSKINLLYSSISKKKKEVDDIHLSIFGYEETDEETGEPKFIKGQKSELDESYDLLNEELKSADSKLTEIFQQATESNESFLSEQNTKLEKKIETWNSEHAVTLKSIRELLPEALTAGLSHAYSKKRESEIASGEKLNNAFNLSIFFLVLVSLIPFAVNAYLLFNVEKELEAIIQDLPEMLTSILPLYIPLAWLAYSSNKKANLSKRLVEEYTHKEVLSKTYEGLSSQVESIEDENISSELRIKLLYNLLDVSAENPGKLISNYDRSDHPLIEVLESSTKLDSQFKKLEKIPGISKITETLSKRSKRLLDKKINTLDDAVEAVTDILDPSSDV